MSSKILGELRVAQALTQQLLQLWARNPPSLGSVNHHQEVKSGTMPQCDDQSISIPIKLDVAGLSIIVQSADIPEPPLLRLRGSIAAINAIWDDNPETWNESSPLRINGVSIPLVFWPDLYRYRSSERWSRVKQRWSDFKVRGPLGSSHSPRSEIVGVAYCL